MVSRYPRVRRVASEALYVLLLGLDEEAACEGIEAAIELLSDTRWDAELTMVKPERNKLYPLLGLEAPAAALEAAVAERAAALAAKSPLAVQGTKQAMLHARDHSVGDGLEFVAMMNSARLTSEDLSEAMGAKFARRAPTFSKL